MNKSKPWMDPIAFAYAQNFDEVETARSQFENQRRAILDRLNVVTKATLASEQLKVIDEVEREDGWDTWFVASAWTKIRLAVGKKSGRQAGVCVGIDRDPCFETNEGARFGFGTYAFFVMTEKRYSKLRAVLTESARAIGAVVDYSPTDLTAYVRCAWIRPGEETFTLDAFEEQVQRLPGLFTRFDRAVEAAYNRSKVDPKKPDPDVPAHEVPKSTAHDLGVQSRYVATDEEIETYVFTKKD
ncbi:MAG: hypothetical protein H0V89_14425 [Deltaproteobacteria bacterium]|nr:hypothetical protein [Deltaproteobacteria bacterium]